jgi:hypothetical protein
MTAKTSFRFFAMFAMATLPNLCTAQTTPYRTRVTVTRLKPDMVTDWVDLQKNEVVPALKKAGVKTRTVFSSGLFGTGAEYLVSQPFDNFAEFDGPSPLVKALDAPGASRLQAKLAKCIMSSNSYMNTRVDEISNQLDTPPNVIVSVRYRVAPGKIADFESVVKSDMLPVYKKAKVNLTVNRRGPGANPSDVTVVTGYPKYADVNGGPFLTQQLGAAEAAKINTKLAAVATLVEVVIRARVPELSF